MFSASQLYVVAVVSNPLGTISRPTLARKFCQQMLDAGVNLTLVEGALGERPFELTGLDARINYVPVRYQTICWHKESLINIGFSRLPKAARYIAWIDADVSWRTSDWPVQIIDGLQQFSVLQPWTTCYDLGPQDEHLDAHTSFAALHRSKKPIFPTWKKGYTFGHPGYAWCGRRETLENMGGLIDFAALGSADHNMALGMLGRITETFPAGISPQFTEAMLAWQAKAKQFVGMRIGALPLTIEHTWHGKKTSRGYVTRWQILEKYKFNPLTDLKRNLDGVMELAGNKPDLQHDIELYFEARDEDANSTK